MTTTVVREAVSEDADGLAPLFETLGYSVTPAVIRDRMAALRRVDPTARVLVCVAVGDGRVLGVATLHVTPMLHRPTPVGRVTALAVLPAAQSTGAGRQLIEASEAHFRTLGLERIEITSGVTHRPAYGFYRHLGYEDHGVRFGKIL